MNKIIKFSELDMKINGRHEFTDDGALAIGWSAAGFEVNFKADMLFIHFVPDFKTDQPCYIKLTLDNKRSQKFAISTGKEVAMLEDIGEGCHHLKVERLSAGDNPIKFASFELTGDECEILPAPAASGLRFEFIGDSITCGYGNIAENGFGTYYTYHEDSTKTYAYLTSQHFGADMRAVSISGQGIVLNCAGDVGYRIPCFFEHELRIGKKQHDFNSWIPHAVFINAGTNDCGGKVEKEEFGIGSAKFLDRVREVYPDAHIFWVYGMMGEIYTDVLARVISEKNDDKMHFVPIKQIFDFPDECGTHAHPNLKGHTRAAGVLIEAVSKAMGIN